MMMMMMMSWHAFYACCVIPDDSHPVHCVCIVAFNVIVVMARRMEKTRTYVIITTIIITHWVAAVLTLVLTKQIRINIHNRNNTKPQ